MGALDQSTNATPSPHPHHIHNPHPHPVLQRLYPQLSTLRHYLLARLPGSSKNRHRRIAQLGGTPPVPPHDTSPVQHVDIALAHLLDSALVGTSPHALAADHRHQDLQTFTQQRSQNTPANTFGPGYQRQSDIVDYVIWRLFKRSSSYRPTHLLCHGFQRTGPLRSARQGSSDPASSIPGLHQCHVNSHVQTLKDPVWRRLHALLGQGGDLIMLDLLLDCAIFLPIKANTGNYYQLSGLPVSDIQPRGAATNTPSNASTKSDTAPKSLYLNCENRAPGSITFVRSRMLYAKPALNAKGGVRFGLRHIRAFPV